MRFPRFARPFGSPARPQRLIGAALGALSVLLSLSAPGPLSAQLSGPPSADTAVYSSMQFRMVGPFRGGRSTAVTGVPDRPNRYFMGVTGGGVWKTEDAGASWDNVSDGWFGGSVGAVRVAPSDANVVYVGTGSACIRGNTSTGRGMYRSTDGGKTWEFSGLPEAGQIGDVLVHPDNPDRVWVAALGHPFGPNRQRGVFRSDDGGRTWDHVLFVNDSTGAVDLAMEPDNPRVLYAGVWRAQRTPWSMISGSTDGGVYKSTDGGDTWTKLGGGLPEGIVGRVGVTVSPADPDRVWAILEAEPEGGVYRSDDAGRTWTRTNSENELRQRAWYYTHIHADPQDANTVYVLNTGFYRSVDGGETFESIEVPHGDVHDLWIRPDEPETMIVANDGGAQVSVTHGRTWSSMYNQPTAEFYDVAVDNAFPYQLYGAQQDNTTIRVPAWSTGNTIHPKEHWQFVGGCETGPISLHPDHPDVVYAGCYGGVIDRFDLRTGDRRNLVIYPELQLGQAARELRERFQWVSPIVVSPHDARTVFHGSQRVHRSDDGGFTWRTISPDLTTGREELQAPPGGPINVDATGVEVFTTVFSIAVSPHAPDEVWAGTDDGRIHLTRDGGATWTEVTPRGMPELGTVDEIELSPHAPGRAFAAVQRYRMDDWSPYIFRTDDHGRTWRLLTDGRNGIPADYPTRTVREDPVQPGLLYAGTEFGLFTSLNGGQDWRPLQLNLPVTPITGLKAAHDDLAVATQGRSFWVLDDVTPLRQLAAAEGRFDRSRPHLFGPRDSYRADTRGGGWAAPQPDARPMGALLHYWLPERAGPGARLEILDPQGRVLRVFSSDTTQIGQWTNRLPELIADTARGAAPTLARHRGEVLALPDSAGAQRVVWDLMVPGPDKPETLVTWGYLGGIWVPPGTYRARLTTPAGSSEQNFQVLSDPRLEIPQRAYEEQFRFALEVRDTLNSIYDVIRRLSAAREQIPPLMERLAAAGQAAPLEQRSAEVLASIDDAMNALTQTRSRSAQDPIRFPGRLDNQYVTLYENVAGLDEYRFGGPDGPPTAGARQRLQDLNALWATARARAEAVLAEDVAGFNVELRRLDVPGVVIPR